jgi:hypothetical protein
VNSHVYHEWQTRCLCRIQGIVKQPCCVNAQGLEERLQGADNIVKALYDPTSHRALPATQALEAARAASSRQDLETRAAFLEAVLLERNADLQGAVLAYACFLYMH